MIFIKVLSFFFFLPFSPASEGSREVANLTWRKNPHTPVYGAKEFVCLSVCLSVCYEFWPKCYIHILKSPDQHGAILFQTLCLFTTKLSAKESAWLHIPKIVNKIISEDLVYKFVVHGTQDTKAISTRLRKLLNKACLVNCCFCRFKGLKILLKKWQVVEDYFNCHKFAILVYEIQNSQTQQYVKNLKASLEI